MGKRRGRVIICAECGKEKILGGRGLCNACYCRLKREGRLPDKTVKSKELRVTSEGQKNSTLPGGVPARESQYRTLAMEINFSGAEDVLAGVKERAAEEMRPLNMQIVWELKQAMAAKSNAGS